MQTVHLIVAFIQEVLHVYLTTAVVYAQVLHAFERWHGEHAAQVKALLEVRDSGSQAQLLAHHLIQVHAHLMELFQLKEAVVQLPPPKLLPEHSLSCAPTLSFAPTTQATLHSPSHP